MKISYTTVLSIFIYYYYNSGNLKKKEINAELIKIIDPNYKRLEDSDFQNEQLKGDRPLPKELIETAQKIQYTDAITNSATFLDVFNNGYYNSRIKRMLYEILVQDTAGCWDTPTIAGEDYPIISICDLRFDKFMIALMIYIAQYRSKYNEPVSEDQIKTIESQLKLSFPLDFYDNNDEIYAKYSSYYKNACDDIKKIKTILYRNDYVDFYKIYITQDISEISEKESLFITKDRTLKAKNATTKKYVESFGKYSSISANGGFGKSMFLKHLFLCDSLEMLKDDDKSHLVPIYIPVRSFIKNEDNILQLIYKAINRYFPIKNDDILLDLSKGGFLLLFDGLDEIKSNQLTNFFDELNYLSTKYNNNYYVTSSRPNDNNSVLAKYKNLKLEGFPLERAQRYIAKLPNIDEDIKKKFIIELDSYYKLHEQIASNPLLLTIMFKIYMSQKKLPTKTYQFYEQAYSVMYEDHDKIKGYSGRPYATGMKKLELLKLISEFCYIASTHQDYDFDEAMIMRFLNETSYRDRVSPDDFIKDLEENLNLIYVKNDNYTFIHRSFQEYFTAFYCNQMNDTDYSALIEWFDDFDGKLLDNSKKDFFTFYFYARGTGIFSILHQLGKTRFESMIIKPVLKELVKKDGDLDDYLNFIYKTYTYLDFGGDNVSMNPSRHILRLVFTEIFKNEYTDISPENLPDCINEYISDEMWFFPDEDNEGHDFYVPMSRNEIESRLDNMTDEEGEDWLSDNNIDLDNPELFEYRVPVVDIINNKERFKPLIEYLNSDKCELKDKYEKIKEYL